MIDIHCHIVPGIDDGAIDIDEAIAMARMAEEDGIKTIINTSHYNPEFDNTSENQLLENVINFNKILKKNNINIEVLVGNEIQYCDSLLENIDNNNFYTLNNSKFLLLEFSPIRFPKNLKDIVYELKLRGYSPILAHIERYQEVQNNPQIVNEAVKEGALIQINASSVLGRRSKEAHRVCKVLLNNNLVHFVGTDAHGSNNRKPKIKEAYDYISNTYGEGKSKLLFINNPNKVINNEEINTDLTNLEITQHVKTKGVFGKLFSRKMEG